MTGVRESGGQGKCRQKESEGIVGLLSLCAPLFMVELGVFMHFRLAPFPLDSAVSPFFGSSGRFHASFSITKMSFAAFSSSRNQQHRADHGRMIGTG